LDLVRGKRADTSNILGSAGVELEFDDRDGDEGDRGTCLGEVVILLKSDDVVAK
jgi:hypothetical protein